MEMVGGRGWRPLLGDLASAEDDRAHGPVSDASSAASPQLSAAVPPIPPPLGPRSGRRPVSSLAAGGLAPLSLSGLYSQCGRIILLAEGAEREEVSFERSGRWGVGAAGTIFERTAGPATTAGAASHAALPPPPPPRPRRPPRRQFFQGS